MYSVLKGYPIEYDCRSDDNHVYIHVGADDKDYSIAVNVESNMASAPLYYVVKDVDYEAFAKYANVDEGIHAVRDVDSRSHSRGGAEKIGGNQSALSLSYYSQDWLTKDEMVQAEIKHSPDNRFGKKLMELVDQVMAEPTAYILALGMMWGPKKDVDWTFGFTSACGLHDVHYNDGRHDGACFFMWPREQKVVGVFTEFRRV